MNEVSSIGKFLEPLSEAYAHIPFEGYGIAGILSIVLLAFYGIVISRLKITERRKILVRRVCAWCVIVLYSGTVLICNSFYGFLFLPVGILFAWQCIGKKMIFKAAGAAVMLSLCTQTVQMVLLEGMFDIRHFLLNIPWTLIGAASVVLWRLLAKKNKIRVDEFSLGLGPTIFGKQFGETKFSLKLLPFGGACMMGEDDVDDMSEGSFNSKSVWARMSVIVAGPVFNLILAWILCMIIIGWTGYRAPIVSNVTDGYSAQEEGIEPGDVIKKIGGKSVYIWNDISLYNMMHAGTKSVEVKYERDGKDYTVVLEPKQNEGDAFPLLGITGGEMVRPGLFGTVRYGAYTVKYWITYTVDSLKMLISGKVGVKDLSGPVGIVSAVDNVYQEAAPAGMVVVILNLLNIGVLLTANLGVMNLLPLPALDGGRLVFLIIEAVRGKRVPPEKEGMVHFAGFVLLMALMVVIMFNDILKLV